MSFDRWPELILAQCKCFVGIYLQGDGYLLIDQNVALFQNNAISE